MAQRYSPPNKGTTTATMASPMLSIAPELLHDFDMNDELEVFHMDGTDDVQEDGHLDTLKSLEVDVDQAQVCQKRIILSQSPDRVIGLRLFVRAICENKDRQCLEVNIDPVGSPFSRNADKTNGCTAASSDRPLVLVHKTITPRGTTASFDAPRHSISSKHSVNSSVALPAALVLLRASLPQ
jgi:hypothetical protein